jgi:tetraacyldisaccharide 4'-kinase
MNIFLYPFSLIFRFFVFLRNMFYNSGIFKTRILEPKVISVGNIAAGGTGKTPFAELIMAYLLKKGKFAVLVVKGYKRDYDDIKVVETGFENTRHELNTENLGDEALMLLENLSNIDTGRGLLVVGDDKSKSAKFAATKFRPEIIILDDGFQHRKLYRDLDIVILTEHSEKHLIPAGKLREPLKNYKRADIIVLNNKFIKSPLNENHQNKPQLICSYQFEGFFNSKKQKLNTDDQTSATVFCGIGDPESFRELLTGLNINILNFLIFPDHHNFAKEEIEMIIRTHRHSGSNYILTTHKDHVRLKNFEVVINSKSDNSFKDLLFNYPLYYAKIKMQIDQNAELLYKDIDNLLRTE